MTTGPGFAPRYTSEPGNFTTIPFGQTPSQTVGPYLHIGLPWPDGPDVVPPGAVGAIDVSVTIVDGSDVRRQMPQSRLHPHRDVRPRRRGRADRLRFGPLWHRQLCRLTFLRCTNVGRLRLMT